jgi:hypothetical protein
VGDGEGIMCYANLYQCDVSCINSELNITSAMNGGVNGIWWWNGAIDNRCHITACHIVDHLNSDGMSTMHPVTSNDPTLIVLGICTAILICSTLCIWYFWIRQKPKEKDEL